MYVDKKFLDFNEETFGNGKIVIHEKSNEKFDLEVGERRKHMNGLHNETMDRLHGGDIGME